MKTDSADHPKAKRTAIPIEAYDGTDALVRGSAFLMEHDSQVGLVTAAHLALGEVAPRSNWAQWPAHFRAHLNSTSCATFDLFDHSSGPPTPRFQYLPFEDTSDLIADVLLLTGSRHATPIERLSESYHVFSDISPDLQPGVTLEAHGYPSRETDMWPDVKLETAELSFQSDDGGKISCSGSTEVGYSGGPVLGPGGLLAGMTFGHDDGIGAVAATRVLLLLFENAGRSAKPNT